MAITNTGLPPYFQLLPKDSVARVAKLELLARTRMQGSITGRHASPNKGSSTEFAEHRAYMPGDDVRRLDWRAYARRDRYLIREFVDETNLHATIIVDCSGSMAYAGDKALDIAGSRGPASKFQYARCLAAVLANFLHGQQDAVGLALVDAGLRQFLRPSMRKSHLHRIMSELWETSPADDGPLPDALREVGSRLTRKGLVVVLSDLFDDPEATLEQLHQLRHRGNEVLLLHVLADEELTFPFKSATQFRDLEDDDHSIDTDPGAIRADYLKRFGDFLKSIGSGCGRLGLHYLPLNTSQPFEEPLAQWLARRGR